MTVIASAAKQSHRKFLGDCFVIQTRASGFLAMTNTNMIPFNNMPPHSRIWIYQSEREFSAKETESIKAKANDFVAQWTSHDQLMKASMEVFHNLFIVVCVDEKTAPASGCGIDKSVKFIQSLEKEFHTSLLSRMNVAYRCVSPFPKFQTLEKVAAIQICSINELKNLSLLENITVFNNLVSTKEEFDKNWELPLEKSWHKQFVS